MNRQFERDSHPGKPRVLFVGLAESTHTHSWIDLLSEAEMNVRLFALPSGVPPDDWAVRTYISSSTPLRLDPRWRTRLYPRNWSLRQSKKVLARLLLGDARILYENWLVDTIRRWRPDIIHTLGLDPAASLYNRVRSRLSHPGDIKWVLQLRGGSDLTLSRLDPKIAPGIGEILRGCNQLLSDNDQNFHYAIEMGVKKEQLSMIGTVPGTGGIDVASFAQSWQGLPSSRKVIVWPKAYESPWSKALPVFEALKLAWRLIQPCEIYMLAMTPEVQMWYWELPEEIRHYCHVRERIPREQVQDLMVQARVMLAPSLIDGTPNSMFEAMAAGAFPVISPLKTIKPLVNEGENVLFARNLYPDEIAKTLCQSMSDDDLVDNAAQNNLELVRKIADRKEIRPRVIEYYEKLAANRMRNR